MVGRLFSFSNKTDGFNFWSNMCLFFFDFGLIVRRSHNFFYVVCLDGTIGNQHRRSRLAGSSVIQDKHLSDYKDSFIYPDRRHLQFILSYPRLVYLFHFNIPKIDGVLL